MMKTERKYRENILKFLTLVLTPDKNNKESYKNENILKWLIF
jgi:hypothetical protein